MDTLSYLKQLIEEHDLNKRALENRGIRVDDLDTMSITGLAAYVNNEAGKLVMECIQSLADGCLSDEEKVILRSTITKMREDLLKLEEKL